jgi:hypothetical protein
VSAKSLARCPFSIAEEYAVDFMHEAHGGGAQADIHVPVRLFSPWFQHRVAMTFELRYDEADGGRRHDEIRLRWNAGTPLLPEFAGTIRFRIAGANTRVLIDGVYRAPFGFVGRAFDTLLGGRIARASVCDLAQRLSSYLEARQRTWRAGYQELHARM